MAYKNKETARAYWRKYYWRNVERMRASRLARLHKLKQLNSEHKTIVYQKTREWLKNHPGKTKAYARRFKLKTIYGMTEDDFQRLLKRQESVCAICHQKCRQRETLCIDHDHTTGKVRGLLCQDCNHIIGLAKDSPERLRAAATYVQDSAGLEFPLLDE